MGCCQIDEDIRMRWITTLNVYKCITINQKSFIHILMYSINSAFIFYVNNVYLCFSCKINPGTQDDDHFDA